MKKSTKPPTATKRQVSGNHDANPRKKRKLQDARSIPTQAHHAESAAGGSLDLESFVESRKFETQSFIVAMNASKHKASQRAFQSVPRDLRRRTASHNSKRVPKRLQRRAAREMIENNTPRVIPHRRKLSFRLRYRKTKSAKAKVPKLKAPKDIDTSAAEAAKAAEGGGVNRSSLKGRKKGRRWLPTHLWMAKRSHMVSKWGFSICQTPVTKCWRSTYRASELDGCVAWDTSYVATVVLEGPRAHIRKALEAVLPVRDAAYTQKRVVSGYESVETWAHKASEWPLGALAPVTIFWWDDGEVDGEDPATSPKKAILRIHPQASHLLRDELGKVIQDAKLQCLILDLSDQIGSVQLAGPLAAPILYKVLKQNRRGTSSGGNVDAELPSSTFKGLLHSYIIEHQAKDSRGLNPKQKVPTKPSDPKQGGQDQNANEGPRGLFSKSGSEKSAEPVTILPVSIGTGSAHSKERRDCWTVLMRRKHVAPAWVTLNRIPGVKFGGLRELDHLSLVRRQPIFPGDFDVSLYASLLDPGSEPPWILPPNLVKIFLNSSPNYVPRAVSTAYFLVCLDFIHGGVPSGGAAVYKAPSSSEKESHMAESATKHLRLDLPARDAPIGHVLRGGLDIKTGRGAGFGALKWQITQGKKRGSDTSGWCIVSDKDQKKGRLVQWVAV